MTIQKKELELAIREQSRNVPIEVLVVDDDGDESVASITEILRPDPAPDRSTTGNGEAITLVAEK
jgi:hypothetical protein